MGDFIQNGICGRLVRAFLCGFLIDVGRGLLEPDKPETLLGIVAQSAAREVAKLR